MMTVFALVSLLLLLLLLLCNSSAKTYRCSDVADKSVPCVEVNACAGESDTYTVAVSTLSSGAGSSKAAAVVTMCHDDAGGVLRFTFTASKQLFFPTNGSYTSCNDNIFYQDVVESFITGPFADITSSSSMDDSSIIHCYNEIDFNMFNNIYASGIYNKNLNQTGCVNTLLGDCGSLDSRAKISGDSWTVEFAMPYSLLNSPPGCPNPSSIAAAAAFGGSSSTRQNVYRGNFYRINELAPIGSAHCASSTCEYAAWSADYASPASFHQPKYFGFILLV